jgi:phosphoenolpyruvate carboxykinase (ATP)
MAQRPSVYAGLLGKKIEAHRVDCWLVNTGWTGGPHGAGHRMPIAHTRAMVNAALDGKLDGVGYVEDPVFGVRIPTAVPGVPAEVLQPRNTWKDPAAYDAQAKRLAGMFRDNFAQFEDSASDDIKAAGPRTG